MAFCVTCQWVFLRMRWPESSSTPCSRSYTRLTRSIHGYCLPAARMDDEPTDDMRRAECRKQTAGGESALSHHFTLACYSSLSMSTSLRLTFHLSLALQPQAVLGISYVFSSLESPGRVLNDFKHRQLQLHCIEVPASRCPSSGCFTRRA